MERCARGRPLRKRKLRCVASTHRGVQGSTVFLNVAAVCARWHLRESGDFEIADGVARGKWRSVGMGRMLSRCRMLPRLLHACVELCAGVCAPLPAIGTDAALTGTRALHG